MNQCSGKGVCQANGQCLCATGWKSADCSMKSGLLVPGKTLTLSSTGPKYFSFMVTKSSTYDTRSRNLITIRSVNLIDVFISQGLSADPTQFSNNLQFKGIKNLILDSSSIDLLDGFDFSITVFVNGVDNN